MWSHASQEWPQHSHATEMASEYYEREREREEMVDKVMC